MDEIKVILVSCGSFNPPTVAHLRMMEMAKEHLELDNHYKVIKGIYSPVNDSYDKKELIGADFRIEMLKLAVKGIDWLSVDSWEAEQKNWTATLKVLERISKIYDTRVMLVAGSDILKSFNTPGLWDPADLEKILSKEHGLIILERSSLRLNSYSKELLKSPILYKNQQYIWFVVQPVMEEISSTKVRELAEMNCSIRSLVPDAIIEFLSVNKLYSKL